MIKMFLALFYLGMVLLPPERPLTLLALCKLLPPKEDSLFSSSWASWSFSAARMCTEEGITHSNASTPTCPCITDHILTVFINTKANHKGWMNNSSTFSESSHTRK